MITSSPAAPEPAIRYSCKHCIYPPDIKPPCFLPHGTQHFGGSRTRPHCPISYSSAAALPTLQYFLRCVPAASALALVVCFLFPGQIHSLSGSGAGAGTAAQQPACRSTAHMPVHACCVRTCLHAAMVRSAIGR